MSDSTVGGFHKWHQVWQTFFDRQYIPQGRGNSRYTLVKHNHVFSSKGRNLRNSMISPAPLKIPGFYGSTCLLTGLLGSYNREGVWSVLCITCLQSMRRSQSEAGENKVEDQAATTADATIVQDEVNSVVLMHKWRRGVSYLKIKTHQVKIEQLTLRWSWDRSGWHSSWQSWLGLWSINHRKEESLEEARGERECVYSTSIMLGIVASRQPNKARNSRTTDRGDGE